MATTLEHRGVRGRRPGRDDVVEPARVRHRAAGHLAAGCRRRSCSARRGSETEVEHALALTKPAHAVGDHPVLAELMPMLHAGRRRSPPGRRAFDAPIRDADALFVFSSGTTGMPKAVRHTHGAFAVAVRHWRDALGLIVGRPHADHDAAVAHPRPAQHRDGARRPAHGSGCIAGSTSTRCCATSRPTGSPSKWPSRRSRWRWPPIRSWSRYDLSSLRYIMWCATPVTAERRRGRDPQGRACNWVTAYGASELPVIACNSLEGARLDTVGRAVPGVDIRVVSLDDGEPVGAGRGRRDPGAVGFGDGRLPAG